MATFNDRSGADDRVIQGFEQRLRRWLRQSDEWTLRRRSAVIPLAAAFFVLAGFVFIIALAQKTPDVEDLGRAQLAEATTVFTADGKILTRYYDQNRDWVPLDSISDNVITALIDTEDERFYKHWGIDIGRTIQAVFKTAGGDMQGGSTITMQLVRNVYPEVADDPALIRKAKEWLTSLKIEHRYEKDDILEMYLNTVPFLYNAFGIESAAQTYFDKPALELNELEAATLIGMLKGPTLYNPVRNPELSKQRRNVVLNQMLEAGHLTSQEYQTLSVKETPLDFSPITHENNLAPYFAEYVRLWLDDWAKERGYNIYRDGLRVYTTIDSDMQAAAKEAVKEQGRYLQAVVDVAWSRASPPFFSSNQEEYVNHTDGITPFAYYWDTHPNVLDRLIKLDAVYRELVNQGVGEEQALEQLKSDEAYVDSLKRSMARLEAGFIAIDPDNGYIKAWVGGRDYSVDKYDHVALSRRQPGSTFKPFVYATALANGYTQNTILPDIVKTYVNTETGQEWSPGNFEGASGRMMTLADALAFSKNTITAQLVVNLGAERVAEMAHRMGIKSELDEVPSIGLGTSPVSLLEMTAAYTTIANNGIYREPVAVTRIEDKKGEVLATFHSEAERVIPADVAYGVLNMMRGVVRRGTGVRIRHQYDASGDLAAKTGTTQNAADGWFMLIHPDLVMGSWVGFSSPLITFRSNWWGQGAHNALHIVGDFVQEVSFSPEAAFKQPASYTPPGDRYMLPPPPQPGLFRAQGNYEDDYEGYAEGDPDWMSNSRPEPLPLDNGVDALRIRTLPEQSESSDRKKESRRERRRAAREERRERQERERAEQQQPDPQQKSEVAKLNRQERRSTDIEAVLEDLHRQEQEQKEVRGW